MKLSIDESLNKVLIIKEGNTEVDERLEPRHFRLLKLLVDNKDTLIERQTIINEIWNDYPSADDLLTQSISVLRKVLNDTDPENRIIKTIPKKGYIFDSSRVELAIKKTTEKRASKKNLTAIILILIVLSLIAIIVLLFISTRKPGIAPPI